MTSLLPAASLAVLGALAPQDAEAPSVTTELFGEGCLGTSYFLRVDLDEDLATAAEAAVLAEVERLRRVLDWRDEASEFSRLPASGSVGVSAELYAVLTAAERWRKRSNGAFDPAAAHIDRVWEGAEAAGTAPEDDALAAAVDEVQGLRWRMLDGAVAPTRVRWSLDGLAKGAILDAAAARARDAGASAVVFDIGGDIVALGGRAEILISDPRTGADNSAPLDRIRVQNAAVATSANTKRGREIAGELYGHVLDPRTGRPASSVLQASVLASTAVDADALATALLVLAPDEGLELVRGVDGAEALLALEDGSTRSTEAWPSVLEAAARDEAWPASQVLEVEFELMSPSDKKRSRRGRGKRGGAYRRPYVAAWIETPDGTPVRTLCLWIGRERWLR
ncbi:MAG: DUF2271 domain-containing protein, partial [Planctomycetota bacterium]